MEERYIYVGSPAPFVSTGRDAIMTDLRGIAKDIEAESPFGGENPYEVIAEYQRRMNEYMTRYGIVFYQP